MSPDISELYTLDDLAESLSHEGLDITTPELVLNLKNSGYLIGCGEKENSAASPAIELGYMVVEKHFRSCPSGMVVWTFQTFLTRKGFEKLFALLLKKGGAR